MIADGLQRIEGPEDEASCYKTCPKCGGDGFFCLTCQKWMSQCECEEMDPLHCSTCLGTGEIEA